MLALPSELKDPHPSEQLGAVGRSRVSTDVASLQPPCGPRALREEASGVLIPSCPIPETLGFWTPPVPGEEGIVPRPDPVLLAGLKVTA